MNIFKLKTIDEVLSSRNSGLKKSLGAFELFLLGLGSIIGTGIFVITGIAAASLSGPAVVVSYALAGITAIFIALAYTEVATTIPSSGGAYSYAFVSFGEIIAWMTSWMLVLYFLLSASTVAAGWSGYITAILKTGGIILPESITKIPSEGGIINLPAMVISLLITFILVKGTKESVIFNGLLVLIKVVAIAIFIVVAAPHFDPINWFAHNHPFDNGLLMANQFMPFGVTGIFTGATLVFFAYNGFDAIASAAEECKNPKRDITIAILGSLTLCMLLYMVVAGLLVGIIPFNLIDIKSSLASALHHHNHVTSSLVISVGVIIGMVSVILVQIFALSRVILVTARDGLLPQSLAAIHSRYNTPYVSTILIGVIVAFVSGFMPLTVIGTLSSVGALTSFMVVCMATLVLRRKYPDLKRPFKCPAAPFVAGVGIFLSLVLLASAAMEVGIYILLWMILGLFIYFSYARYRNTEI